MPRGLPEYFMYELRRGLLTSLLDRVQKDTSLCLEMREDYLNIYYRGGNLLTLKRKPNYYEAWFDPKYFTEAWFDFKDFHSERTLGDGMPRVITNSSDVCLWLGSFPFLKQAIDTFPTRHVEREVQQLIVADNNRLSKARSTDYFICDIEYASKFGRFDFVAVHWPSAASERKKQSSRRFVVGEVKYGDGALSGTAGLHSHVRDVNDCLGDASKLAELKSEMVCIFNQKRALRIIDCGKDLEGFSDEKPLLLLVLANHDPDKSKLRELLESLPPSPNAEIRIASASFMGYGLYDQGMLTVEQALARPELCR